MFRSTKLITENKNTHTRTETATGYWRIIRRGRMRQVRKPGGNWSVKCVSGLVILRIVAAWQISFWFAALTFQLMLTVCESSWKRFALGANTKKPEFTEKFSLLHKQLWRISRGKLPVNSGSFPSALCSLFPPFPPHFLPISQRFVYTATTTRHCGGT